MRIKIKENITLPKLMDINEIKKILFCTYSEINSKKVIGIHRYLESLRNVLVIKLLFATTGTISEKSNLKKLNINLITGHVILEGKVNKEIITRIFHQQTMRIMEEYVKNCNEHFRFFTIFYQI